MSDGGSLFTSTLVLRCWDWWRYLHSSSWRRKIPWCPGTLQPSQSSSTWRRRQCWSAPFRRWCGPCCTPSWVRGCILESEVPELSQWSVCCSPELQWKRWTSPSPGYMRWVDHFQTQPYSTGPFFPCKLSFGWTSQISTVSSAVPLLKTSWTLQLTIFLNEMVKQSIQILVTHFVRSVKCIWSYNIIILQVHRPGVYTVCLPLFSNSNPDWLKVELSNT